MTLWDSLTSPLSLAFGVILVGCCLDREKIFGISFDLAGVLIAAVAVGYALAASGCLADAQRLQEIQTDMKMLSSLGTALFVSVIGIITGYSFDIKRSAECKAIFVGALMIVLPIAAGWMVCKVRFAGDRFRMASVIAGGMTSTPAIAILLQKKERAAAGSILIGVRGSAYHRYPVGPPVGMIGRINRFLQGDRPTRIQKTADTNRPVRVCFYAFRACEKSHDSASMPPEDTHGATEWRRMRRISNGNIKFSLHISQRYFIIK